MAKISLRMYNREIEGLVEQQRLEEATAHCRQILKSYPKHLETYRLLGKAYLEAKRYDQAVDIFQRVLVAAPEDFVSHVGMSIISDDKGKLDDAIWHMERAFEVQPSNAAIQGELQRLFGRRDGVEPPKIRLTRGALAHMYVQGELYNQAIAEIRAVLSNDSKRTDMQTLLARAYFRNGQKAEATQICTELISHYQYCLDANRLMAEILPGTQRPEAAQEYRDRVVELDPYAAFVQDSLFHSDAVGDNVVSLERLEYTGQMAEMPPSLGLGLESETPAGRPTSGVPQASRPAATASNLPAWLSGVADSSSGSQAMAAPTVPPSLPKDDIPDFIRQAGWDASSTTGAPESPSPFDQETNAPPAEGAAIEGDLPEWVKALAPTDEGSARTAPPPASPEGNALPSEESSFGTAFAADTPDWLRNLGPAESSQLPKPAPESVFPAAETPSLPADAPDWLRDLGPAPSTTPVAPEAQGETPDWLKNLAGRELDEPAAPPKPTSESDWLGDLRAEQAAPAAPEPPAEESPDWLKDFSNDLETPIAKAEPVTPPSPPPVTAPLASNLGSLGTSAQEQDDAMAWLEGLAAKHGAKPEELVTDPNARTEVAPEWVDKAKEIGEQVEPAIPAPVEDETGIWLRSLEAADMGAATTSTPAPEEPAEVKPFDLRSSLTEKSDFAGIESESQKEEPPIMGEAETPSWLGGFAPKPAERIGMEDAPDWLRGTSKEAEEAEQPAAMPGAQANIPTQPPPSLETAKPAEESEELPTWLAGLDKEQPPMVAADSGIEPSEALPAWLQLEAEPEPETKEPAKPTDWRPVQLKPVGPPQPVAEAKPAAEVPTAPPVPAPAAKRVVEEPAPMPPLPPTAKLVVEEPTPHPAPPPAPKPVIETVPAAAPAPTRPKPVAAVKPSIVSLGDAQSQLGRGNIAAALDIYGKLIRKGKSLEDIIRDLRDALYRYPVEVPLWQSLGDAYMRANRLQEALDAYTKAEELLR